MQIAYDYNMFVIRFLEFATVYRRFYCRKVRAAANQICPYTPNELESIFANYTFH